jgi:hypothetical protein
MPRKLPGIDGIPFYTNKAEDVPVDIRTDDLKLRGTAEVYILDLSKKEDLDTYAKIMTDSGKGLCVCDKEDVQWIAKKENWKIFIRILRYYYTLADEDLIL